MPDQRDFSIDIHVFDPSTDTIVNTLDINAVNPTVSVLVGGLANLLLRATTNKTFRTTMEVDVEGGKQYQLSAIAEGDQLEILVINHTDELIVQSQTFKLKDGKFERTF